MKMYDCLNHSFGTHKIKVNFQAEEYKGAITYLVGGNCKGREVFPSCGMDILDSLGDRTTKLEGMIIRLCDDDDDWFGEVTLTADNGDTCEFELESEAEFENMIVRMEILDFVKESEDDEDNG